MTRKINNKYELSEKSLRVIRQRIFDYPEHLEDKADRVLRYLKKRMLRMYIQESSNYHWMYAAEGDCS